MDWRASLLRRREYREVSVLENRGGSGLTPSRRESSLRALWKVPPVALQCRGTIRAI